jgi:hypothetical protein
MKSDFNLPPGVRPGDISAPQAVCEEPGCGKELFTDQEHIMGLCEEHLAVVVEELPE